MNFTCGSIHLEGLRPLHQALQGHNDNWTTQKTKMISLQRAPSSLIKRSIKPTRNIRVAIAESHRGTDYFAVFSKFVSIKALMRFVTSMAEVCIMGGKSNRCRKSDPHTRCP
jgi:hypothetical protein